MSISLFMYASGQIYVIVEVTQKFTNTKYEIDLYEVFIFQSIVYYNNNNRYFQFFMEIMNY